jgi:hypothetical protein
MPVADDPNLDSLAAMSELAGDLLATLNYNLSAAPDERLPVQHCMVMVDREVLPKLRRQVVRRTARAIEDTKTLLESHPPPADQRNPVTGRRAWRSDVRNSAAGRPGDRAMTKML